MMHLALATLLFAITASASAQAIYRCPEGRYSQEPCEGGAMLSVADERTRAQQVQSAAATERDVRLADQLQRERVKQEAQPVSAYLPAARTPPVTERGRKKGATKSKASASDDFTAAVPGSGKGSKKPAAPRNPAKQAG